MNITVLQIPIFLTKIGRKITSISDEFFDYVLHISLLFKIPIQYRVVLPVQIASIFLNIVHTILNLQKVGKRFDYRVK